MPSELGNCEIYRPTRFRFYSELNVFVSVVYRYCIWVGQLPDPTRCFRQFQTYLNTVGIGEVPNDPEDDEDSYSSGYASELDDDHLYFPPPPLAQRVQQEPLTKVRRVDEAKWKANLLKNPEEKVDLRESCAICFALPPKVVFKNCGHCCCCAECALKMKDGRCPLCRASMDKETDIIRIFG